MANTWGGTTVVLDTQSSDSTYDSTHDFVNGGTQYNTGRMCVQGIRIQGATNGQTFTLRECTKTNVATGNIVMSVAVETGDLRKSYEFPGGKWVNGIVPTALPGGTVLIDLL